MAPSRAVILFSVALALLSGSCFTGGEAAQCRPDDVNPCIARCNGTTFDLSKAFDFPITFAEAGPRFDGKLYGYVWSPCEPTPCESGDNPNPNCAICQSTSNFKVNCGQIQRPIWLMDNYGTGSFPNWQIEYPWGTTWRISMFNFVVDDDILKPQISYISENPPLQYNFLVVGKCIGQDTFECRKVYAENRRQVET